MQSFVFAIERAIAAVMNFFFFFFFHLHSVFDDLCLYRMIWARKIITSSNISCFAGSKIMKISYLLNHRNCRCSSIKEIAEINNLTKTLIVSTIIFGFTSKKFQDHLSVFRKEENTGNNSTVYEEVIVKIIISNIHSTAPTRANSILSTKRHVNNKTEHRLVENIPRITAMGSSL